MRRQVASNLAWMLTERGMQVAGGIGIVAMLARGLGPEGFAHFQYAQAVVYIAASVALICGGEVVIPRLVANTDPVAQHRLVVHAFGLRFGAGVLAYLMIGAFMLATRQGPETWIPALILGITVMLREPSGIVTAWMQSHTHTRPNAVINISSLIVKAAAVGLLFWLGNQSVPVYAAAISVEPILAALLLAQFYLSRAPTAHVSADAALARELFSNGTLFWVSFMLMMGSRRVDQLLLKPFVSLSEFGAYAATMQILDNFVMVASILAAGIAPMYVYAQPTLAQARRNIGRIACGMVVVGITGCAMIALSAHWIIQLLYGSAFASAAELLQLAAMVSALVFADVALTLLPVYMRRPQLVALKWGVVFATTIVVDSIAIPHLGARGAILGYAVANLLAIAFGITIWLRQAQGTPAQHRAKV
ncbi:lipopolysaccharide biosynthesis protein [Cupriavidus oxalaticus]|uniref:Lipopolysaccharide biosynthesis protein n=1 Tax=Cupriavidus oxalaticus TaxID=96344 RepID=A0A375G5N2_9BURK|nr:oligosaccharide flippase family protein [Cupriavidus oxalaticus]QRQ88158.1 oligosaccharide flippase family protein [Cupriavidus oxalaticus]QRQ93516.1 oligosaccharide flippase family protein [Cupriavidus oxalaticus]WQD82144.1 oligosaccharide flippase family protein [Cupriavidus oxalaticus]SPC08557.1 putative lipopolysaccharide o-antigen export integral membrane protein [Cupriavidus oxalaticus]SPC14265.1 putative lipopolysaccharide biosynthesis protein [Cupriavidus oxalaticus]